MEAAFVYAVALGAAFALLLCLQLALATHSWRHYCRVWFRKWITDSPAGARQNGSGALSVGTALGIAAAVGVNIFVSCFHATSNADVSGRRLGLVAIANLTVLFVGGRSSPWAEIGGIPLPIYHTWHRWLGRVCLAQGFAHAIVRLSSVAWKWRTTDIVIIGLLAALGLGSVLYLRRRFYEIFLKLHLLLTLGMLGAMWVHITKGKNLPTICLALASFFCISNVAFRLARIAYRNWPQTNVANNCSVEFLASTSSDPDAVQLKIRPRRPWTVRHGQYVYITVPSMPALLFATFQSHPYLVAWSDSHSDHPSKEIYLFIQGRDGFSRALRACQSVSTVIVDGPHGKSPRLDCFDKVLLVAQGVGIAAHLLTIRHLLRAHEERTAQVRRISLVWILEGHAQEKWAISFLETLLDSDVRRIFTILIYRSSSNAGDLPATQGASVDPKRSRLYRIDQPLDAEWLINNEWLAEAGSMAVSLCAPPMLEHRVRTTLRSCAHDIRLWTSPFEMDETAHSNGVSYKKAELGPAINF